MNYLKGPLECETILVFTLREEAQRLCVAPPWSSTSREETNKQKIKKQRQKVHFGEFGQSPETNMGLFLVV